ncbi:MAG: peptidoglycan DD-metalloendopeptidase family protein [Bacteroidia bacterium]|nr:peptidoglycan DD-metalloendopeptidase family protein [Bacteroidia bacterium]NND50976.1 peptidoglycan DD-metalloendopeptidase family protein [Flavobacteriaceae bacterium]
MKLIVASLLLFIGTFYGFGQDIKEFPDLKLEINTAAEETNLQPEEAIETIDIKDEHWNTRRFNPYTDALVKFPLHLKFEEQDYASPLLNDLVITSRFGWRHGRPHKGIDIDLHTGDEVVSILDGIVRFASYNSGHGKTVIVRHFNGLETTYAHLSAYSVKVNDTVQRGQILGKGGATGNARGSHLHLITSYKGIAINPEYLFDFSDDHEIRSSELWVTRRWTDPYHHSSRKRSKLELLLSKEEAIASLDKEKKIYIVKRGDTLSHISRRNNVSIRSICVANNIKTTSLLKVGQKLVLEL